MAATWFAISLVEEWEAVTVGNQQTKAIARLNANPDEVLAEIQTLVDAHAYHAALAETDKYKNYSNQNLQALRNQIQEQLLLEEMKDIPVSHVGERLAAYEQLTRFAPNNHEYRADLDRCQQTLDRALKAVLNEQKIIAAEWQDQTLMTAVTPYKGSHDGFAQYLCGVLADHGITGANVAIKDKEGKQLGFASCPQ